MAGESRVSSLCMLFLALVVWQAEFAYGTTPDITPFPGPLTIHEDDTAETRMAQVQCTVPGGGTCTCNSSPINIATFPFMVMKKPGDTAFYIYYLGDSNTPGLNFQLKQTYIMTITCTDEGRVNSSFITAEIDVLQNQSPIFTTTSGSLTLDANTPFTAGSVVETLSATDPEGDTLTYSISTNPIVDYFIVDPNTGEISTTIDLRQATVDRIFMTASVTDTHSTVNNVVLDITITNPNVAPDFTTLPAVVYIDEDSASGTSVHQLVVTDTNSHGNPVVPDCQVAPAADQYKFQYTSGTQLISLATMAGTALPLDYETTNRYIITCTATDGYLTSTGTLTVQVQNINEPPVFNEVAYFCSLTEADAGGSTCSLNAVITDPENNRIVSTAFALSVANNSNRFYYDMTVSTVTFAVDYDVDQPTPYPQSVILQLVSTDVFGASSSVPVYITIADANDNVCSFVNFVEFDINQSATPGALGTLVATDNDVSFPNNDVTFTVTGSNPVSSSTYMTVFSSGAIIYLSRIPGTSSGNSFTLSVECRDAGTPQLSKTGNVAINFVTTTSSTTTTTTTASTTTTTTASSTSTDPFDDPAFLAVFIALMVILFFLLLGLLYLLCRACAGKDFCFPKREPKVRPRDNPFNHNTRTNNEYRDAYWKSGDKFESGEGYNPKGDVVGNSQDRPPLYDPLKRY